MRTAAIFQYLFSSAASDVYKGRFVVLVVVVEVAVVVVVVCGLWFVVCGSWFVVRGCGFEMNV